MDRGASARVTLDAVLATALTHPTSLDPAALDELLHAVRPGQAGEDLRHLALGALAAVLYGRPELAGEAVILSLAEVAGAPLPADTGRMVVKLFEYLASSPWAAPAWTRLEALLRDERLGAAGRELLVPLVGCFVRWRGDLVGLDAILRLAGSPALADHRAFLLDHGVEPFVFSVPGSFTVERLDCVAALFGDAPRYGYVLQALAARRALTAAVRAWLGRELRGRFPLQAAAAAIVAARPWKLLVVHNLGVGQGDDVVGLVPLLQGLLDANPALSIALVTQRTYLYDNPRVAPVSITDDATVHATLHEPFDGVVELFQPGWPELAIRPGLHAALDRALRDRRLSLVIRAALGRPSPDGAGLRSEIVYPSLELDGTDVAATRGLDRPGLPNVYEPCLRLQAELGLPQRAAEEAPLSPSILTGVPSADAEQAWRRLVGEAGIEARRPTALVNPFGGSMPTKGFLDQAGLLAAEITGLVDEGYLVVLLPNGTPWGGRRAVLDARCRLTQEVRAWTRIAPDPVEANALTRLELRERLDLAYPDRIARLFKYFATYADLVVTVEGWMAHLAYCLGRPFRLFLAAGSFPPEWHPYGRGSTQRLVATLSPRSHAAGSTASLLGEDDPPPLPHGPRKTLLELALAGLASSGRPDAPALLRRALASADYEVRTWAVAALARLGPPAAVKPALLAALQEREPTVVREAAQGLLRGATDCSRELGPRYREHLALWADIIRHDWTAVERLGPGALPVLFHAAKSESHGIRHEARAMLRRLLAAYVPGLRCDSEVADASGAR